MPVLGPKQTKKNIRQDILPGHKNLDAKRPHSVHECPIPTPRRWMQHFYIQDFELSLIESVNAHGLSYGQHTIAK
jgi:hypothetical protein